MNAFKTYFTAPCHCNGCIQRFKEPSVFQAKTFGEWVRQTSRSRQHTIKYEFLRCRATLEVSYEH
jgi:hypothetical protein